MTRNYWTMIAILKMADSRSDDSNSENGMALKLKYQTNQLRIKTHIYAISYELLILPHRMLQMSLDYFGLISIFKD